MMNEWLLIIFTILLSGFFSGSEIAFVTANRLKLEIKARQNTRGARYLNHFVRNPEKFLATTLVGNNIVNVVYATLMTFYLVGPIRSGFHAVIGRFPSEFSILLIQTTVASLIIMLLGEILPKAIFRIHSDSLIYILSIPLTLCNWILKPFIVVSNGASKLLIKMFGAESDSVEQLFRRQDIEMMLRELREEGANTDIDKEDTEILNNVLELSSKRVKDSMIPRTEIVAVETNTILDDVLKTFISSGFSKLPVYKDSIDDIIGVVFAYDLFLNPKSLDELIRPVKMVPSSQKSKNLLQEFRQSKISLAIVIDEYGGTAGMVTIEDLLEEVVGDIQDEYDTDDNIIKKLTDDSYVISGNVELEEMNEKYPNINMPDSTSEYETIAGYIINEIGRIPKVNEEIIIGHHKFIISKATPSKIDTVKMIIVDK
ncbi:MAG TPA: hemolysin family protein [Balneolales bacterium]|nr:hemolysin family protein [Balneolales bacterium]